MLTAKKLFLSRSQAAKEVGISAYLLNRAIASGELRATRLAGRIFIANVRLEEWLRDGELQNRESNGNGRNRRLAVNNK